MKKNGRKSEITQSGITLIEDSLYASLRARTFTTRRTLTLKTEARQSHAKWPITSLSNFIFIFFPFFLYFFFGITVSLPHQVNLLFISPPHIVGQCTMFHEIQRICSFLEFL